MQPAPRVFRKCDWKRPLQMLTFVGQKPSELERHISHGAKGCRGHSLSYVERRRKLLCEGADLAGWLLAEKQHVLGGGPAAHQVIRMQGLP